MNTLKQRITGIVAAGLLTVSGVATIAQPAYAAPAKGVKTSNFVKSCTATDGTNSPSMTRGPGGASCTWHDGDETDTVLACGSQHGVIATSACTWNHDNLASPLVTLRRRTTGFTIITTTGIRPRVVRTAATGITRILIPGQPAIHVAPPDKPGASTGIRTTPVGTAAG